jgi:hypothetical protein
MSRSALDQAANDVRTGNVPDVPVRVGSFWVRKAEVQHDVVCLWTDVKWSGYTGLVQCPPEEPPFNLWSHVPLDASWQFISED